MRKENKKNKVYFLQSWHILLSTFKISKCQSQTNNLLLLLSDLLSFSDEKGNNN